MRAKEEYRDRPSAQVAVLDALVDRNQDGMTVFELRSHVGVDIDNLETALSELKTENLIQVSQDGDRTVIKAADEVRPEPPDTEGSPSIVDWVRDRFDL